MKLIITFFLFCNLAVSGQTKENDLRTEETEIESGKVIKKYNKKELENFTVEISANTYYNSFFFSKEKDTIIIKNLNEDKAVIKIYVKDKKKVSEFLYEGILLFYSEIIDFDTNKLPSRGKIWGSKTNDEKISYHFYRDNLSKAKGDDFEKSFKLYSFLKTSEYNVSTDLLFNEIADFFSEEDAVLKIYSSKYRDKTMSESKLYKTAFLSTNKLGQIKIGVLWKEKSPHKGEYTVYDNGKIIKTENVDLNSFQPIFNDYYILNYSEQD
ncbi:MAG: hypothetical protein EOO44_08220 [Flavobacterium sp.]|nr:MAG: hypothetical protein EOO44_08220 [Flavobacterium sp.]